MCSDKINKFVENIMGRNNENVDSDLKESNFVFVKGGRNLGRTYKSEMNEKELLIQIYNVDEKIIEILEKIQAYKPNTNLFGMLLPGLANKVDLLKELADSTVVSDFEEEKRIVELEQRKKHCRNYLELKQINRELQSLKFNKSKRSKSYGSTTNNK